MDAEDLLSEKGEEAGLVAGVIAFRQADGKRHVVAGNVPAAVHPRKRAGIPTRQHHGDAGDGQNIAEPMPVAQQHVAVEDIVVDDDVEVTSLLILHGEDGFLILLFFL